MRNDQENKEQARKLATFHDKHSSQKPPAWLSAEAETGKTATTSLNFEDSSDGGIRISDSSKKQLSLTSDEAYSLWQWLSAHKDFFHGKHLEIHLYQEDLGHLDELKAAIPDLQERGPIVKVLDVQWDAVSERAVQILGDFQIEYLIHPMLEEHDTYEQG